MNATQIDQLLRDLREMKQVLYEIARALSANAQVRAYTPTPPYYDPRDLTTSPPGAIGTDGVWRPGK